MSVNLRKRKNKDGTTSLILDIYHNGNRHFEFLKELKLIKASNPLDRIRNSENLALAKKIVVKKAQELESNNYQVISSNKDKVDFVRYLESYIDNYKKNDVRNMKGAVSKFKLFLKEKNIKSLTSKQVSENLILGYKEYLENACKGEGAASYFARFKKILKQAVRDKLFLVNPASEITIKKNESFTKDILTSEEIQILANTKCSNTEVKRAFLFSCLTGLRFVDIKALKWQNIELATELLTIFQSKTGKKVTLKLHTSAIQILGTPGKKGESVFHLPSHTGCLKSLKKWLQNAEIEKHITWHCARHSFGTNIILYGADVNTASNLLGHTSLKYTQLYTHVVKSLKEKAIDNLPTINL
ncbi:MAG: tyrosine-type recombinase/integrase [Flavipsychrobacter sp.]